MVTAPEYWGAGEPLGIHCSCQGSGKEGLSWRRFQASPVDPECRALPLEAQMAWGIGDAQGAEAQASTAGQGLLEIVEGSMEEALSSPVSAERPRTHQAVETEVLAEAPW